jgi:hypothetical protein
MIRCQKSTLSPLIKLPFFLATQQTDTLEYKETQHEHNNQQRNPRHLAGVL